MVPSGKRHPLHLCCAVLVAILVAQSVRAQTLSADLWITNGPVNTIEISNGLVYLGGAFTQVGPPTGGACALDATTGSALQPYPLVTGTVWAVASDGSGGWYIGGFFTAVRGQPRQNLAHLDASGELTPWNPAASSAVRAIAVSGSTVYVGGNFGAVGGQSRNHIAAIDAVTGAVSDWNPGANDAVLAIAVGGDQVFVGGVFMMVGGQWRYGIASIHSGTGAVTSWDPSAAGSVWTLVLSGNTLYAGGAFIQIGGQDRVRIAALDVVTGAATAWNPAANFPVLSIAVSDGTVYAGGMFTTMGGLARNRLAAIDAATGAVTAWNPDAGSDVRALAVSGSTVYVGGLFDSIGGVKRHRAAAIDAAAGALAPWNPNPFGSILALAVSGSTVFAGGSFASIGGHARSGAACIDAGTGAATAWDPDVTGGAVLDLAVGDGVVHLGGEFDHVGGQPRAFIAATDATTGAVTGWDPNSNAVIRALAISEGSVFAGGEFTTIGGQPRAAIAALDGATGLATGWNPDPFHPWFTSRVHSLLSNGGTIYVGGDFTSIGGQPRNSIGALDATTGLATGWNPNASSSSITQLPTVHSLSLSGGTVYAAGYFTTIGGQARQYLAALEVTTGAATAWNPDPDGTINSVVASTKTVYVGGDFDWIGQQDRGSIAALDAVSGQATAWQPPVGRQIYALAVDMETVYAGGSFTNLADGFHPNFTGISRDDVTGTLLARFEAGPVAEGVEIRWRLGESGQVSSVTLERAESLEGPWRVAAVELRISAGVTLALDRGAEAGRCHYRLALELADGTRAVFGPITATVGVPMASSAVTAVVPNPAPRKARIDYTVAREERIRISVLDVAGREVEVLVEGTHPAGRHSVIWDGRRAREPVAPGVYLVRCESPTRTTLRRLVIVP